MAIRRLLVCATVLLLLSAGCSSARRPTASGSDAVARDIEVISSDDSSVNAVWEAVDRLAARPDTETVASVLAGLPAAPEGFRDRFVDAIGKNPCRPARDALVELLQFDDPYVPVMAASWLARRGDPSGRATLMEAREATQSPAWVREIARDALAALP